MRPQDWKSGDRLWSVEITAPFGGAEEMLKNLKAIVFLERFDLFDCKGERGS
jgi:hemolysin-activating ACP:hemolysin acyltransferase